MKESLLILKGIDLLIKNRCSVGELKKLSWMEA